MKTLNTAKEVVEELQKLLPEIQTRFGITRLLVYGSYASTTWTDALSRGIDIMVESAQPLGTDFIDLRQMLVENLQRQVNLTSPIIIGHQRYAYIMSREHMVLIGAAA